MPCFTVRTTTVDLTAIGKIDPLLLARAFTAMGHAATLSGDYITFPGGTYSTRTGKIEGNPRTIGGDFQAQVKRAYSGEVVKATAKKYGWSLKEVTPFEYAITKR